MKTDRALFVVMLGVAGVVSIPRSAWAQTAALHDASIAFTGRVSQLNAAAFAEVPRGEPTIVVVVTRVIEKPSAIALKAGDDVTVRVENPSAYKKDDVFTFYVNGWIFGQKLAVREVAHEATAVTPRGVEGSTAPAPQPIGDAKLRDKVAAADSVVVGRVTQVRTVAAATRGPGVVREHDFQWKEAVIQVTSAIKGEGGNQRVVVRFPYSPSNDVAFRDAPKFRVGQSGTFLLHRTTQATRGSDSATFEVMTGADVLPATAAARVRSLTPR